MNPRPAKGKGVVRIPIETAEKVGLWASVLNVSHGKVIEIAVNRWEQQTAHDPLGLPPLSDDNAPHKAND